jgi:hypothetical protein
MLSRCDQIIAFKQRLQRDDADPWLVGGVIFMAGGRFRLFGRLTGGGIPGGKSAYFSRESVRGRGRTTMAENGGDDR